LKARPEELLDRIENIVTKLRDAEKELDRVRSAGLRAQLADAVHTAEVAGVVIKRAVLPAGTSGQDVRQIATELKGQVAPGVECIVVAMAAAEGRVNIAVSANEAAIAAGKSAGELLGRIAPLLNGRGGGKAELAQGSGSDEAAIPVAMAAVDSFVSAGADAPRCPICA